MKDVGQIDKLLFNIEVEDNFGASFSQKKQSKTRIIIEPGLSSDDYRRQLSHQSYKKRYKKSPTPPQESKEDSTPPLSKGNYYHLLLKLLFLFGGTALFNLSKGWSTSSFLFDTIGFYLILHCFICLIDSKEFSSAFGKVDPISKHYSMHSTWFPFILLILGACILNRSLVEFSLLLTITLFTINSFGILQAIITQQKVKSLSLGALLPIQLDEKDLIENSILVLASAFSILVS